MHPLHGLYTQRQAAEELGVNVSSIKRFVAEGILAPATQVGRSYLYSRDSVLEAKAMLFPEGLSYAEIAQRYDKAINTVKHNFRRLGIKPVGYSRRVRGVVYDPDTVTATARSLGWQESQTSESSSPASAS